MNFSDNDNGGSGKGSMTNFQHASTDRRPALMAFIISFFTIAALVFFVTVSLDRKDTAAKQQMVGAALKLMQANLERQILNFSWWDQAIENVIDKPDMAWIDDSLGGFISEIHGISACFVVNVDGSTLVAYLEGETTDADAIQVMGKHLSSLIASLFPGRVPEAPDFFQPATESDFFMINGRPHLVTVSAFTPEEMVPEMLRRQVRPVLVLTRAMDRSLTGLLSDITQIRDLKLVTFPSSVEKPYYVLKNSNGRSIAKLAWPGSLDGRNLLKILLPMVILALTAVAWFTRLSLQKELALRKEAEAALRQANQGLEERVRERTDQLMETNATLMTEIRLRKSVEKEILVISEREQRNVGQDIHDGLCQQLTGILCHMGTLEMKMTRRKKLEPASLENISDLLKETLEHAYDLSRGLCPLSLDPSSLLSSLQQLTVKTGKLFDAECAFEFRGTPVLDDSVTALQLYRIAQEALTNAAKHSGATRIVLRLESDNDRIRVSVTDDGNGFDKDRVASASMGLKIIAHRASIINGILTIDTSSASSASSDSSGSGTRIICSVPLTWKEEDPQRKRID